MADQLFCAKPLDWDAPVTGAWSLTVLAGLSEKPIIGMDGLAKRAFGSGADESLDEAFRVVSFALCLLSQSP